MARELIGMRMTVAAMGKNRDQEGGGGIYHDEGRMLGAGKRRGNFLERAGSLVPARDTAMRSRVRARKDARADRRNAKLLKMPTLFPKLLETKFSCFAKFSRMPTSFSKFLEMLLG